MNFPKKTLLASFLMISASGAFAVETATLTVKGSIQPTACSVSLAGTGEVKFENIEYTGAELELAKQDIALSVLCDPSAAAVSLKLEDSMVSTLPAGKTGFGLGVHDGVNIGHFRLNASGSTDASGAVALISQTADVWSEVAADDLGTTLLYSFYNNATGGGTAVPTPSTTFSTVLSVTPTIAPDLIVGDGVELDGSVTVTVDMI